MANVPIGFNGAISPTLKACVSQDCAQITFSDVTLMSSVSNPYGWTTDSSATPRPRILTAFSEIRVIAKSSLGEEVINMVVYAPPVNYFPAVADFNDNMPLATTTWGLDDGVYTFTYRFTYQSSGAFYGDSENALVLAGNTVEVVTTQVITCNAQNEVKDLWLKYLNDCCSANREKALEAEALLFAVEAAASCADEYNASRIKEP